MTETINSLLPASVRMKSRFHIIARAVSSKHEVQYLYAESKFFIMQDGVITHRFDHAEFKAADRTWDQIFSDFLDGKTR